MKKYLGRLDLFSIVVGAIIGWGSFMLPGTKFLKEGGVINTALGLVFGALCIVIIEKNYEVMMNSQNEAVSYTHLTRDKLENIFILSSIDRFIEIHKDIKDISDEEFIKIVYEKCFKEI